MRTEGEKMRRERRRRGLEEQIDWEGKRTGDEKEGSGGVGEEEKRKENGERKGEWEWKIEGKERRTEEKKSIV